MSLDTLGALAFFTGRDVEERTGRSRRTRLNDIKAGHLARGRLFAGKRMFTASEVAAYERWLIESGKLPEGAGERLQRARQYRSEIRDLGRLAWEVVRAGTLGPRLRLIGCDVPLPKIPHGRRMLARAELARVLALAGRGA